MGKTRLVEEFIKNKKNIYFFITRKDSHLLLEGLSESIRESMGYSPSFADWEEALEYLFTQIKGELVIVFDEFQNLSFSTPSAFSQFQASIDKYKNEKGKHVIILGSYISMIKRIFTEHKEPLFGRADEFIDLKPLSFPTVHKICCDLGFNEDDGLVLYSLFGGIPKYYVMIQEQGLRGVDPLLIVRKSFFCQFPLLAGEIKSCLVENIGKNYHTYFSILEAVALGHNTLTGISEKSGIKRDSLSKYIGLLADDFDILEYRAPVTHDPRKSKKGRYFINDRMTNFWFSMIWPHLSMIEQGNYNRMSQIVKTELPSLIADSMEKLVRWLIAGTEQYDAVGSWWNRRGDEIDAIALDHSNKRMMILELKWRNRKTGVDACIAFLNRSDLIQKYGSYKKEFLFISRSGFTKNAEEILNEHNVKTWDGDELMKRLREKK